MTLHSPESRGGNGEIWFEIEIVNQAIPFLSKRSVCGSGETTDGIVLELARRQNGGPDAGSDIERAVHPCSCVA